MIKCYYTVLFSLIAINKKITANFLDHTTDLRPSYLREFLLGGNGMVNSLPVWDLLRYPSEMRLSEIQEETFILAVNDD